MQKDEKRCELHSFPLYLVEESPQPLAFRRMNAFQKTDAACQMLPEMRMAFAVLHGGW
jgi:hypothetical protein